MVAAASNHAEGFHAKLKTIINERKGFVCNISKLQDLIYKRLEKYASGLAAEKQCNRFKRKLLKLQTNLKIQPVESCQCQTNKQMELIIGNKLPCTHTIQKDSIIKMTFPTLDTNKFIKECIYSTSPSELEGVVSFHNTKKNILKEEQSNIDLIDQIDHLIELKKRMISSFNKNAFTEETEKVFIENYNGYS